jgi:hypothetical protein
MPMQAITTLMKAAVIGIVDNHNEDHRFQYEQLLAICVDELFDVGMSNEEIDRMINNCML